MMITLSDHYDDDDNGDYGDDEADDDDNDTNKQRNMFSFLRWKTAGRRCRGQRSENL